MAIKQVTIIEEPNDKFVDDLDQTVLFDMLRKRRTEYQMTSDEVAEELGFAGQTILNWEMGKTSPQISDLYRWCRVLGLRLVLSLDVQT